MKILIDEDKAIKEILTSELYEEISKTIPSELIKFNNNSIKGFWDELLISILSSVAAELLSSLFSSFAKKHKVTITLTNQKGETLKVKYSGDSIEELNKFLIKCVEKE